jgi:hypothetical protein
MTKKPQKQKPTSKATPKAALAASNPQPTFSDIQNLLDRLVPPSDPNIQGAPHDRFWRQAPTNTRDGFVSFDTSVWGGPNNVPMVTPGNTQKSAIFLALSALPPFDGSQVNQMPDTGSDPLAKHAQQADLDLLAAWINNGAPA